MKNKQNSQRERAERQLNKPGFFKRNMFHIFAFLAPFMLMSLAFVTLKLYPFGDQQIMVVDSWHQYFPFLKELRRKLVSGDSILYSWNIGGGTNFLTTIAYYASSPIYLLSVFVPEKFLTEFMAVATLIKIGLAGLTFSIFLKGMYKRSDLSTVAFSTLYGLCAFSMGYYWTLMWLDCVALLPLIMLGLNKLIDEGKYKMYVFSLAACMFCHYYIGTFICMFVAVYYIVAVLSRYSLKDIKTIGKITGRVVLFSALGVAMASIIVLPTYFAMTHSSAITNAWPTEVKFYKPWLDIFNDLLSGVNPNRQKMEGSINIGCGMLSVVLLFIYMFNKKINVKERVAHVVFLLFMVFTFNLNILDFVFHAGHFPNELPHRYAFIFSFVLVMMAYRAFLSLKDVSSVHVIAVLCGMVAYLFLINKIGNSEAVTDTVIILSIMFTVLYCVIFLVYIKNNIKQAYIGAMLCILALGEGYIITQNSVKITESSSRSSYIIGMEDVEKLYADITSKDTGFFRVENTEPYTINPGALYGFRGVSTFNSTCNSRMTDIMNKLGFAGNVASNRYTYYTASPVMNSFMNVKYLINRTGTTESEYLTYYNKSGDANAYSYNYPLALGFMTSNNIRTWQTESDDPFVVQNSLAKTASGVDIPVFNLIERTDLNGVNADIKDVSEGAFNYTEPDSSQTATITMTYDIEDEQTVYAYIDSYYLSNISVTVNGASHSYGDSYPHVIECGRAKAGSQVVITMELKAAEYSTANTYVYGVNDAAWQKVYDALSDEQLDITEFSSTHLKGKITATDDGVLYTSIPYEEGWKAYVDGKKAEIVPLANGLITLNLTEGEHEIKFSYLPEGFIPGIAITVVVLGLIIALIVLQKKKKTVPGISQLLDTEKEKEVKIAEVQFDGSVSDE